METGIDLVHTPKFQSRIEQTGGVEMVFTNAELAQNPKLESLAGIFAAKEAFMKAIGKKIDWHDVWIEKKESGQSILHTTLLAPGEEGRASISHTSEYATAVMIVGKIDP